MCVRYSDMHFRRLLREKERIDEREVGIVQTPVALQNRKKIEIPGSFSIRRLVTTFHGDVLDIDWHRFTRRHNCRALAFRIDGTATQ